MRRTHVSTVRLRLSLRRWTSLWLASGSSGWPRHPWTVASRRLPKRGVLFLILVVWTREATLRWRPTMHIDRWPRAWRRTCGVTHRTTCGSCYHVVWRGLCDKLWRVARWRGSIRNLWWCTRSAAWLRNGKRAWWVVLPRRRWAALRLINAWVVVVWSST